MLGEFVNCKKQNWNNSRTIWRGSQLSLVSWRQFFWCQLTWSSSFLRLSSFLTLSSFIRESSYWRLSSIKGHLPSKVFFPWRSSSIKGSLLSQFVCHQRSSSESPDKDLPEFIMSFIVTTLLDLCHIFLQLVQLFMFVTIFAVPIGTKNSQEFYKISRKH